MTLWPLVILGGFSGILGTMFVFILGRRAWRAHVFRRLDRYREHWERRLPALLAGDVPSTQEMRSPEAGEALQSLLLNRLEVCGQEERKRFLELFEKSGLLEQRIRMLYRRGARWERLHATMILGQLRCAAAVPALVATLEDPWLPLQTAALRSLGAIGSPAAGPAILHFLRQEIPEEPIIWLESAVACVSEAKAFWPFLEDEREEVRALAARAIAEFPHPAPFELLKPLAFDANPEVRAQAMRALGRSNDERGVSLLVAGTWDEVWFVRLRAVSALANANTSAALEAVLRVTGDQDFRVRQRAAVTLASLASRPGEVLEWIENMQDRYALESFLSQLARSGLLWRSLPLLMAPEDHKRQDAEKLLRGAVAAGYYLVLLNAVETYPEWRVRVAAARLLARANNPDLSAAIERRLKSAPTPRSRRLLRAILRCQPAFQQDEIHDSMAHHS